MPARTATRRWSWRAPPGPGFRLTHPISGADLGEVERAAVKKITLTNALRTALRGAIAALSLNSPDPAVRIKSATELMRDPSPEAVEALRARLVQEQDAKVRDTLDLALAATDLRVGTTEARLAAIAALAGSLHPEARNGLAALIATDPEPDVKSAATQALATIDSRLTWNARAETLFFGLSLGSVLVLAAIGLAITFGVMGVINMAHGELMMLGAYTTYLVQQAMPGWVDYSLFVAIPAAFIVSGLFGIAIERTVIRFLYGRPLETLLATFGISLILQQLVRTTISAQNVAVENPSWMSGSLQLNPALALTYNRLYILAFAVLVFLALLLILKRTALGLQVRAVSQNRDMARAMGVRSARVDALTFGLGSGIAGIAGCRPVPTDQRRTEHGAGLHHRLVHGGGVRWGRKSVGDLGRRHDVRRGQQVYGALGRRGPGQDPGAGLHHPLHPETSARLVPAAWAGGGGLTS